MLQNASKNICLQVVSSTELIKIYFIFSPVAAPALQYLSTC